MNEVGNAHKKTRKKLDLIHLVCVFIIVLVLLALSPLWLTLIGLPFGAVPGPGLGDWRFHGLPGNWEVWRLNGRQIDIVYVEQENLGGDPMAESYVSYVAWTDDFIFAQQVTLPEDWDDRDEVDDLPPAYYLIDIKTHLTHGPYDNEADFLAACEEQNTGPLPDWIRTTKLPDKDYGN